MNIDIRLKIGKSEYVFGNYDKDKIDILLKEISKILYETIQNS